MDKIIRVVDEKLGITQITCVDERWYVKSLRNPKTGLPDRHLFVPSVTWIVSCYPKGVEFYKWLASKGWDEAEAIKHAAGNRGSKVHLAVADLTDGKEVKMNDKYPNSKGEMEELTLDEYECLMSFSDWAEANKPEVIARETVVFNEENNYAGTVDLVCKLNGVLYIIDYKTGQYIWPEHEIQLSAYKHAKEEYQEAKIAVLQLGYRRNRARYKFTDLPDKFGLFLNAQGIWKDKYGDEQPKQKDYPLSLKVKMEFAKDKKVEDQPSEKPKND